MKFLIIILIVVFFLSMNFANDSFGYSVDYQILGKQFSKNPLVCTYEPTLQQDPHLKQWGVDRLSESTRLAVQDWQSALQQYEKREAKDNWRIDYKVLSDKDRENNLQKDCNVIIQLNSIPLEQDEWYRTLGVTYTNYNNTGVNLIKIYYRDVKICQTRDEHYIYNNPCYGEDILISEKLRTTITHEMGHALGLGHYQADDPKVNVAWAKGGVDAPSIMAVFSQENSKLMKIKPIDVEKIKLIYTPNGFKSISEHLVSKTFESFSVDKSEYYIKNGMTDIATITGIVTKDASSRGQNVLITQTFPDGHTEELKAKVDDSQIFLIQIRLDQDTQKGQYHLKADYMNGHSDEISFSVLDEINHNYSEHVVPDWIKQNARWWSEGNLDDQTFVNGIQFLVKNQIIKVSNVSQLTDKNSTVPKWIKNNARWWSEGQISENDFLRGIQYLASNGLISVGNSVVCDATLWDYVYQPSRLKIINDCTSVSGIIASIRVEADGDYHIGLNVDSQYQNLINKENIQKQHGNLVLEVICQKQVKQENAIEACSNYSGHIDIPNIGDHVIVTGPYVLDLQHGGWAEIHPVNKFEIIQ